MSDIALRAEGLSKLYRIGLRENYRTIRDAVTHTLKAPFRRFRADGSAKDTQEIFWALKDVSFEVRHGETLGIIGSNGAGKSTLLKILSRITEPTRGAVTIHGRVASLLEVGTGFHPELSGRENIFLNGAILGMNRAEVRRKFDEIVAFAEVEKFIDTPVKRYSSGMYVRLAFAVAAHLEPEILLVDEVLAVGDARFQKKCLDKMGEVTRHGRTILFVSHNLTATASLCRNTMWLCDGQLVAIGPSPEIISNYLREEITESTFDLIQFPEDPDFRLNEVHVCQDDNMTGPFETSRAVNITFKYTIKRPVAGLRVGMDLLTSEGLTLWRTFDDDLDTEAHKIRLPGDYEATCCLPANSFFARRYVIALSITVHMDRWITLGDIRQSIEFYNVSGVNSVYADEKYRAGVLMPGLNWTTTRCADARV